MLSRQVSRGGNSPDYALKRLKRDNPELAAKVVAGEVSAHKAAVRSQSDASCRVKSGKECRRHPSGNWRQGQMVADQQFIGFAGLVVTLFGLGLAFFKYYLDAKIDPIAADVKRLLDYMISQRGRIARLEERQKS
jgi:hypothetical protein